MILKFLQKTNYSKSKKGFSLVEILVIVAILSALLVAISPKITRIYNASSLISSTEELIQTIRLAKLKSMQSESSMPYSVKFVSGNGGSFTLFQGTNYANRDTYFDEVHTLNSSINLDYSLANSSDTISFSKIVGTTANTGSITISWPDGNKSKIITINSYGVITRQP